jgi:hypothetical protein
MARQKDRKGGREWEGLMWPSNNRAKGIQEIERACISGPRYSVNAVCGEDANRYM